MNFGARRKKENNSPKFSGNMLMLLRFPHVMEFSCLFFVCHVGTELSAAAKLGSVFSLFFINEPSVMSRRMGRFYWPCLFSFSGRTEETQRKYY